MEAKAKILGHPIHQMLIVLPLGLLSTAVIFDIVHLMSGNGRWSEIGYCLIAAGVVGGLLAAPFGLVDWLAVPARTRAKRIGAVHGIGNVIVVLVFALSWLVRRETPASPATAAYFLSFVGFAIAGLTGWLGGELVNRLGVGVYAGAHLDAPNTLSGRPAVGESRQ